jgi:endonuclease/exonuclease/phosphatase family metal-dependent hydrolase
VSERQTARVVTQVAPDIAGLTELYQVPLRDQPDRLARLTRMHAAFHGVRSAFGGSYGNLLLSPHPVRETARFSLGGRREERGCLLAHVDLDGTTIVVALVHLSLAREVRRAQLVQLAAELPTDRPLVLLGDFNAGAEELEALEPWLHDSEPAPPTYPSLWPMRALDHVLVSEHFKIVSARAWPSLASDHRPLVVDLRLR